MKPCRGCGETKPLQEFYEHPGMADGRLHHCKPCKRGYAKRRHREKMKDPAWREAERRRGRKRWRNGARATPREPIKRAASVALNNAVRDGRVVPAESCEDCGHDFTEFRREAHHEDYSKPLKVDWLCALCHGLRHRQPD